ALLTNFQMSATSSFQCNFTVQPDYRYEVQISSNLVLWSHLITLLATNTTIQFADTNPPAVVERFYRAVTQP
ncbi:MAG TPA: hypothetical protein VGF90_05640, partial [Verrucomicrobiae bacterium]